MALERQSHLHDTEPQQDQSDRTDQAENKGGQIVHHCHRIVRCKTGLCGYRHDQYRCGVSCEDDPVPPVKAPMPAAVCFLSVHFPFPPSLSPSGYPPPTGAHIPSPPARIRRCPFLFCRPCRSLCILQ